MFFPEGFFSLGFFPIGYFPDGGITSGGGGGGTGGGSTGGSASGGSGGSTGFRRHFNNEISRQREKYDPSIDEQELIEIAEIFLIWKKNQQ